MLQNRSLLLSFFVAFLLASSGGLMFQQTAEERQETSVFEFYSLKKTITQGYTLHNPIIVRNNTELAIIATDGNGSSNNPYIIAGWNITSSETHGIYITGTTKHFRIENCWIDSSNYDDFLWIMLLQERQLLSIILATIIGMVSIKISPIRSVK